MAAAEKKNEKVIFFQNVDFWVFMKKIKERLDHTDDCGFTAEIRFLGLGKLYVDLFSKLTMLLRAT